MTNSARREKIDPIWYAPILFILIGALIALTAVLFNGTLRSFVAVTLISDRAGLVMENGAKVKLRGVQVGEVGGIGTHDGLASLNLKLDPGPFKYLPSNVEAEIKSSTAFGAKYVDLIVPSGGARRRPGETELRAVGRGGVPTRQGRAHRRGHHVGRQPAAHGEPADVDGAAGLATVRPDHRRLFRCR
jgi:ABC-type transporter Mla subunit MlaD